MQKTIPESFRGPVSDSTNRTIFETNTVKFFEDVMVQGGNTNQIVFEEKHDSPIQEAPTMVPIVIRISGDSLVQDRTVNEPAVYEPPEMEENSVQDNVDVEEEPIPPQELQEIVPLRRSTRERRSAISKDYVAFLQEHEFDIGMMEDDPLSLRQALESVNSQKWIEAMNEEMKSMYDNKVWDIVPLPKGLKPVGCKWIFKTKKDSEGNVERYKARLVAKKNRNVRSIQILQLQVRRRSPISIRNRLPDRSRIRKEFRMDL